MLNCCWSDECYGGVLFKNVRKNFQLCLIWYKSWKTYVKVSQSLLLPSSEWHGNSIQWCDVLHVRCTKQKLFPESPVKWGIKLIILLMFDRWIWLPGISIYIKLEAIRHRCPLLCSLSPMSPGPFVQWDVRMSPMSPELFVQWDVCMSPMSPGSCSYTEMSVCP